jgi:parallel beta-helix repeat protein
VPNSGRGIYAQGVGTTIDSNIISGNASYGVYLLGGVSGITISNNLIGTAANGSTPLGNGDHGVYIWIAQSTTVGPGNTIAYNSGAGIYVASTTRNSFTGNSIHDNGGLGIDLSPTGMTPNDSGDGDTGANNLQNYPVLSSATSSGSGTTVVGMLNTRANTSVAIEFYWSPVCDSTGFGEGQTMLGSIPVATTDASGNYTINQTFPTLPTGRSIAAIATTTDGTSEFSRCVWVNCPGSTGGWAIPTGDSDCDGLSDSREASIGTDPVSWCASTSIANDEPLPDHWPVDFNDDEKATVLDVSTFSSHFGAISPAPAYNVRWDLNADGKINVLDVSTYSQFFNKSCSP